MVSSATMNTTDATRSPRSGSRWWTGYGVRGSQTPWSPIRKPAYSQTIRRFDPSTLTANTSSAEVRSTPHLGRNADQWSVRQGSPAGMAFASKNADTIIMMVRNIEAAKAFRAQVSELMRTCGREPNECKVMFATSVVIGETDKDARDRRARNAEALAGLIDHKLVAMSFLGGMDCSELDLDAPLFELKTNASRSALATYLSMGKGTLREALQTPGGGGLEFVGSADSIAGQMAEAMAEIGATDFSSTTSRLARP
jgi:alkanesulfonate monooxygenase SsuD/methylene tetrahydromethanopterin reductase-like flavin-dependent oxidoreductase (luciferase family)